jgi:hypothetical protein
MIYTNEFDAAVRLKDGKYEHPTTKEAITLSNCTETTCTLTSGNQKYEMTYKAAATSSSKKPVYRVIFYGSQGPFETDISPCGDSTLWIILGAFAIVFLVILIAVISMNKQKKRIVDKPSNMPQSTTIQDAIPDRTDQSTQSAFGKIRRRKSRV